MLALQPNDDRAMAMLADVERDRRQRTALASAKDMLSRGQTERALLTIESALKDSPRDPELLKMQRSIELSVRRDQESSALRLSETRPISLDFRDANLRMILEALTRSAGVNFVVDKDVRQDQRATVFLRQTRLEDALELLCTTNQLSKKVLDNQTVLIYPNTPEKSKEYQDLVIRAFYLSSADAKQVAGMLKSLLKVREPYVDDRLSLIVIRETPETIRLAERLVALQDVPDPEVMMEVEVLEIGSSRLTELGIQYPNSITLTPLAAAGTAAATLGDLSGLNRDRIGITNPSLTLNLRREISDSNLLANPRIRARNREKAKILIGDKLPVITSTATSTGFVSESVQYIDVGLKLDVEPNIYLDDEVAIKVGLEVSSLKSTITTRGGSTAYQIGTRSATTVLRLRDGETQILAGLINKEDRLDASRIPGIGDLPVLGRLFASQQDNGQKTEIVLSITPHIIRNIRRPDINQAEFWSGSENNLRSRPLRLSSAAEAPPSAGNAAGVGQSASPNTNQSVPFAAPPPNGLVNGAAPVRKDVLVQLKASEQVVVGSDLLVALDVTSEKAIRGLPAQISYDRDKLQLLEIQEGAFLKQGGATVSFTQNIDASSGSVTMGGIRNTADGAAGSGSVATLRFKTLQTGTALVSITSANPIAIGETLTTAIGDPLMVNVTGK